MVNPKKTSKCPGCKVLKSANDFGPPGKHCPGPDLIDDDHGNQATFGRTNRARRGQSVGYGFQCRPHKVHGGLRPKIDDGRAVSSARDSRLAQVSAYSASMGSAPFFFVSEKRSQG